MQKLNFPDYSFRFKNSENNLLVFDEIRKKFVVLTPEEWVRIHVVQFLMVEKNYPKSLINVEKVIKINGLTKRYDIVVFQPNGTIFLVVECKQPNVAISQTVFDQIDHRVQRLLCIDTFGTYLQRFTFTAGQHQ